MAKMIYRFKRSWNGLSKSGKVLGVLGMPIVLPLVAIVALALLPILAIWTAWELISETLG